MSASFYILFLFLVSGFNLVLGQENEDPCKLQRTKIEKCERRGGYCFDYRCDGCKEGTIKRNYCGRNVRKLCCLPEKPPKPTPMDACCNLFSDPHILTYDGFRYDVQVPGDFVVSKPCNSTDWEVIATFDYPYGGAVWTEIIQVTVNLPGEQVVVQDDGTVTINGVPITLPYLDSNFHIYQIGNEIHIYLLSHGVKIVYDLHYKSLDVCVKNRWFNNTCGLCANWNDDKEDDKANDPEQTGTGDCPHPRNHFSWRYCLRELKRILKRCRGVSFKTYLEACAFDFCAEGREGAQLTLNAARKHCATDVGSIFSNEEAILTDAMSKPAK